MRKHYFTLVLVGLFFIFAGTASAEMYGSINTGYVMTSDTDLTLSGYSGDVTIKWDDGFGIGVALGNEFDAFRLEGELEYRTADMDSFEGFAVNGDIKTLSFLVNGYYDMVTQSAITPFIGVGIGFARHESTLEGDEEDDTVIAYQVSAGAAFDVSDAVKFDLYYRYFGTDDPKFGIYDAEYASHNILLGFRIKI